MNLPTILYFASILLTLALTGFLSWYASRQPAAPGVRSYAGLAAGECLLALVELLSMTSATQSQAHFWFNVRFLFSGTIPVLFLIFSLEYFGRKDWLSRPVLAVAFVIPVLSQVIIWVNGLHGLWVKQDVSFHQVGSFWMVDTSTRIPAVWFMVHSLYSLALLVAGMVVILLTAWRMRKDQLGQAFLLLVGALVALVASLIPVFNLFPQLAFNPFVPGIGLSSGLYALAVFRFQFLKHSPAQSGTSPFNRLQSQEHRSLAAFILVFILFVAGIAAIGFVSYQRYADQFNRQMDGQLTAIAALKVDQLETWRAERLGDAKIFYNNPVFSDLVQTFLGDSGDLQTAAQLQAWLAAVQTGEGYERLILLDSQGVERLAAPNISEPVSSYLAGQAVIVMGQGQIAFMDFYRTAPSGPIRLALLVPIYAEGLRSRPLGVVVLQIDPAVTLYPFIREWPTVSSTAETLLVRRDGDKALYLNDLKFAENAALSLSIPLADKQVLAVKAILGQTGVVAGVDYRSVPVIGYVGAVPNSPWFLVARMDTSEVYAPLYARLWETLLFFGALILAGGAGLGLLWRQQAVRSSRAQVAGAQALLASEARYRSLFEAARDGILILDGETGLVEDVNPFLVELLGFTRTEIIGRKLWELGFLKDIAANQVKFQELQDKGYIRYEDLPLQSADGREIYFEFVSNVYQVDHHKVIQCNIRDISERKRSQDMLHARLRLLDFAVQHTLAELLQQTLDEVCVITDSPIGFYHFVEEDQSTLSLQAWSTRTLQEYCRAEGTGLHYDVNEAGVWADCIRQRKAVIHNDYAVLPYRKGLPEGHSALTRELVVPIFREDRIVAILGIGNRAQDYTEKDIEVATFFADVAWEIAQQKRGQEAIQASEIRFRSLFENMLNGFAYCRMIIEEARPLDFIYLEVNRTFETLTGLKDVVGRKVSEVIPGIQESDPELLSTYGRVAQTGVPETFENYVEALKMWFAISVYCPQKGYFVAVFDVITERKRAEQSLKEYNLRLETDVAKRTRELQDAQEKIVRQERLATLGQLAGSVGHELRNPLGVISNAVYYLKMTQPDANKTILEYLDIIEKETHNSDKIVTDLLDFTRLKSVNREPAEASELLRQTFERYPVPDSVEVKLDLPSDLPQVYADPAQVVQVLGNLITNACQAMAAPDGVAQPGKLTLSASLQSDMIVIAVHDTGMGIPPENLGKLFEPLFTTKTKGIGLGLAVSQRLIEANDGRIEARSMPGKGSTFLVYLPVFRSSSIVE